MWEFNDEFISFNVSHLSLNCFLRYLESLAEVNSSGRIEKFSIECSWEDNSSLIFLKFFVFDTNNMPDSYIFESFTYFLRLTGINNYKVESFHIIFLNELFFYLFLIEKMSRSVVVLKNEQVSSLTAKFSCLS